MEEKGVACNDDERGQGTEQTVVHRNSIKEHLLHEANLICSPTLSYIPTPASPRIITQKDTGIVDSSATHLYITPSAPHGPPNTNDPQISVGIANGQVERSSATDTQPIPQLEADFSTTWYIVPYFTNTLVGVETICDADCIVVFTKQDVIFFSPGGKPILTGWIEKELPRLWRFALKLTEELLMHHTPKR